MALRFGLLGTGYWAAEVHAAGLADHPDAALVGVWGRDPAKATAVADRYGTRGYSDLDALLADVDAVAVALPPDVQADLATRAARAGKHLLLDKPLALTTRAADALVDAVGERDVASVVFFTRRYSPGIEDFLAAAAATGGWAGARVTHFASIFQPGNPYGQSPWRRDKGGLWDVGPHALSLVLPVLGPASRVYATIGPYQTAYLSVDHQGGAVSTLGLTVAAPPTAGAHETVFYGEAGLLPVPGLDVDKLVAYGHAVSELVAAAAAGPGYRAHRCDVRFGREVVAILAAAETSAGTGTAVVL